jgi:hypothetical protein
LATRHATAPGAPSVAFAPGAALYSRLGGNLVTLREVLDDLERQERQERRAAA